MVVNRLEQLLREADPELSLHYWNWTTDPRTATEACSALFTPEFMGNAKGDAGHLLDTFESTEDSDPDEGIHNGHFKIWRDVGKDAAKIDGTPDTSSDDEILANGDFASFARKMNGPHATAHTYIGGTINFPHFSFHDPFVFLLQDRLWAKWQTNPAHPDRKRLDSAYLGLDAEDLKKLSTHHVEPWASDPTKKAVITYTDLSIVTSPRYDTNYPTYVRVREIFFQLASVALLKVLG